jgi:hypothetical protein
VGGFAGDDEIGVLDSGLLSHPSHKNKGVVRVGHPGSFRRLIPGLKNETWGTQICYPAEIVWFEFEFVVVSQVT